MEVLGVQEKASYAEEMASFVSFLPMKGTSAIISPVEGLLTCHPCHPKTNSNTSNKTKETSREKA